jgi:hypothetical protein
MFRSQLISSYSALLRARAVSRVFMADRPIQVALLVHTMSPLGLFDAAQRMGSVDDRSSYESSMDHQIALRRRSV